MTSEERRQHVHRFAWAMLPGVVSGLLVAGMAYGTITARIDYITRDIESVKEKNSEQDKRINRNRELIYSERFR